MATVQQHHHQRRQERQVSKILGLAGKAGAGKDHTYEHIRDKHLDLDFLDGEALVVVKVAYADGVREEIEDTLGADIEALWQKPYPDAIRRLLQWWGTELRRAEDPNYWVKKGMAEAKRLASGPNVHLVVITDVRFANEADVIREVGGRVYEVVASDDVRRERLGGQLPPAHASEEIDFEIDGYIYNQHDGSHPLVPGDLLSWCGGGDKTKTGEST